MGSGEETKSFINPTDGVKDAKTELQINATTVYQPGPMEP